MNTLNQQYVACETVEGVEIVYTTNASGSCTTATINGEKVATFIAWQGGGGLVSDATVYDAPGDNQTSRRYRRNSVAYNRFRQIAEKAARAAVVAS